MYRSGITFSRLCERHQSLARIRSTTMLCLPKLDPSTLQIFRSICSSNSSLGHARLCNFIVDRLSSKSGCSHFYQQPCRRNSCFSFQKAKWDGSSFFFRSSSRCYVSSSVPEVEGRKPIHLWGHETVNSPLPPFFFFCRRILFLGGGNSRELLEISSQN